MRKCRGITILLLLVVLFFTSCTSLKEAGIPIPDFILNNNNPTEVPTAESSLPEQAEIPTVELTPDIKPTEEAEIIEETAEVKTLVLWIPPQFDPTQHSNASEALQEFIKRFTEEHPEVNIVTRVKATSGNSSMLATLSAAKNAAPAVVPSLILMSRSDMETAIQRGLIQPINTTIFNDGSSWYNYAKQGANVDNEVFGIPVGGDAPILTYRAAKLGAPLTDWADILNRGMPISFAPSSSNSQFATFFYLALGGKLTNDQGQVALDQQVLMETLTFFLNGGQSGVFPPSITQIQDETQSWQRFNDGTANLIISRFSSFRHYQVNGLEAIALPAPKENAAYPLVTTWNLVMTETKPDLQRLSIMFAEGLSAPEINSAWTLKSGLLPVRRSDNEAWIDDSQYNTMITICENGTIQPSTQTLNKVVPVINEAVLQVIKNAVSPEQAALTAVDSIK